MTALHTLVNLFRDVVIRPYPDGHQHPGQRPPLAAEIGQSRRRNRHRAPCTLRSCIHFSNASDDQPGRTWPVYGARRSNNCCLIAALWGTSTALVGAGLAHRLGGILH